MLRTAEVENQNEISKRLTGSLGALAMQQGVGTIGHLDDRTNEQAGLTAGRGEAQP